MKKVGNPLLEKCITLAAALPPHHKIALWKWLNVALGHPAMYTADEVDALVVKELEAYRARLLQVAANQRALDRASGLIRHANK